MTAVERRIKHVERRRLCGEREGGMWGMEENVWKGRGCVRKGRAKVLEWIGNAWKARGNVTKGRSNVRKGRGCVEKGRANVQKWVGNVRKGERNERKGRGRVVEDGANAQEWTGNVRKGGNNVWKWRGCVVKGRGAERKGSKDVSPCCRLGLSRWTSITFIGWMLLY